MRYKNVYERQIKKTNRALLFKAVELVELREVMIEADNTTAYAKVEALTYQAFVDWSNVWCSMSVKERTQILLTSVRPDISERPEHWREFINKPL